MSHRFNTKYFYRFFFSLLFFTTCVALTSFTKNEAFADASTNYIPLAPIGNFVPASGVDTGTSLGTYINSLFKLGIAAAGFLAVIMLVIGGIQYMASEIVSGKEQAKGRINDAVLGLVLAISSYLILNTINPDILDLSRTKVDPVTIEGYQDTTTLETVQTSSGGGSFNSPNNPIVDKHWEGPNFITTYADGSSQVLYFDSNGNGHLARFGPNNTGLQSDMVINAGGIQYDTDGFPIRYQNSNGTYSTIGGSAGATGPIASMTQGGKRFPNEEWNRAALEQIEATRLVDQNPNDVATYFPNGPSAEGYLSLIASIAEKESGFNPRDSMNDVNNTNSVGLLSLSAVDSEARAASCNEECLKDPIKNIKIGISIFRNRMNNGNCIACRDNDGSWTGDAAYWSTLQ